MITLCNSTLAGRRMQKCRASQDTGDDDLDKFNDEYINLGPQWQIPNPEEGPLEQRVATTFIEGLFKGEPNLEESNYWFTEPPGALARWLPNVYSLIYRIICTFE